MSAESPAYWAIRMYADEPSVEVCFPEWTDFPIESFLEEESSLVGYTRADLWNTEVEGAFSELMKMRDISWEKEFIPPQNWNALWESGFDPVLIPGWCVVRAEFHDRTEGFRHEIIIRPQMAFGTGHHETTYMMLEWLRDIPVFGKRVLDYGCGTGILGILAAKLGAKEVIGVDIEEPAIENAVEHSALNQVSDISWKLGDISVVPPGPYDLILANINRNVLLASADELRKLISPNGELLISGILAEDKEIIDRRYSEEGFQIIEVRQKGNWLSILMRPF